VVREPFAHAKCFRSLIAKTIAVVVDGAGDSSGSIVFDYWTTERSGFDPRQGQRIFFLTSVSRPALRTTCPMGTGGPFPGTKHGRGVTLTTHPHVVPRSRMSRSYASSPPKHHHGV
jgi:hypothetical protein